MSSETLVDPSPTLSDTATAQCTLPCSSCGGHADNLSIVSTFSTNYTMSNLIGAGRTLGLLYSRAGRAFEKSAAFVAEKAGYGPQAIYNKLLVSTRTSTKDEPGELVTDVS